MIFEFIASLTGDNKDKYGGTEELLNTTIKYFSLVNEELTRLKILPGIFDKETQIPDNLGECLCTWLKTEEREYVRDCLFEMLSLSDDPTDQARSISKKLHQILDIEPETFEKITTPLPITGEKLVSILSAFFVNK